VAHGNLTFVQKHLQDGFVIWFQIQANDLHLFELQICYLALRLDFGFAHHCWVPLINLLHLLQSTAYSTFTCTLYSHVNFQSMAIMNNLHRISFQLLTNIDINIYCKETL